MRRLLALTLVLMVLLAGVIVLSRDLIAGFIVEQIQEAASDAGLVVNVREQSLTLSTFTLIGVSAQGVVRGTPVSLVIDEARVFPHWMALVFGSLEAEFQARLYRGSAQGSVQYGIPGRRGIFSLFLERLELSEHPFFALAGVDRGQLSFEAPSAEFNDQGVTGTIDFRILKARKSRPTVVSGGLPMPITLPSFERLDVALSVGLSPGRIVARPTSLSCDFGQAAGDLVVAMPQGIARATLEGAYTVSLSEAGKSLIGDWLPVVSQGTLQAGAERFSVQLTGPSSRPQIRMTPL